jgi:hypothetical protein
MMPAAEGKGEPSVRLPAIVLFVTVSRTELSNSTPEVAMPPPSVFAGAVSASTALLEIVLLTIE